MGCGIEPRNGHAAGAETVSKGRTQHEQYRYARYCRPAGVEGHITRRKIALELGRSRVWPSADDAGGPHREGAEPKPMMHEHGKSDEAIVAMKPTNRAERSATESVERRAEAKGNACRQSTLRTLCRAGVPQAPNAYGRLTVDTRGGSRMRE